jgi:triacylglycerol esterase/lipase EstA (alpha/beta hydrolase family)
MDRPSHRALALVLALLLCALAAPAARADLPVIYSFPVGLAAGFANPTTPPPGANDFACRPSAAHPRPVVLVHGTFENEADNWNALSPLLKNHGYCVFAFDYGGAFPTDPIQGTGPIATSAGQLASFVDQVLSATGASQVDLVGHSQGGMMPRWYLKLLGGAAKVHALVGLSPSNHGTTLDGIGLLAGFFPGATELVGAGCPACTEQLAGSSFLTTLNAGGDTVSGVTYTVITTIYDEVVTPYTSAFLSGPAVTNITVQNGCVIDLSDHVAIAYDRRALYDVLNALDPADPLAVPCDATVPGVGG